MSGYGLRMARADDMEPIAILHRHVFRSCLPYLPELHTAEEDRRFFSGHVFTTCTVWIAEDAARLVGYIAFRPGWIDHLYVDPAHHGRGVGTALLEKAREAHDALQLWAFQRNGSARRFYERHGFRAAELTDGAGNEEREPDVRYAWSRD